MTNITSRLDTQNDLTLTSDWNRPITTDLRHLSPTANNITAKLTNQLIYEPALEYSTDNNYLLNSDDDFRSGCRNISHYFLEQSFSELNSHRRCKLATAKSFHSWCFEHELCQSEQISSSSLPYLTIGLTSLSDCMKCTPQTPMC